MYFLVNILFSKKRKNEKPEKVTKIKLPMYHRGMLTMHIVIHSLNPDAFVWSFDIKVLYMLIFNKSLFSLEWLEVA